jgi:Domain of unknown function (DUF4340)
MQKRTLLSLVVIAAVLTAVFLTGKFLSKKPLKTILSDKTLLQIKSMEISDGNQTLILKKSDKSWHMSAPIKYPANTNTIEAILSRLSEITYSKPLSTDQAKHHVFGIDDKTKISFYDKDGNKLQSFFVGKEARIDSFYLAFENSPNVYEAGGLSRGAIIKEANSWLDNMICDIPLETMSKIVLYRSNKRLEFSKNAADWFLETTASRTKRKFGETEKKKYLYPIMKTLFALRAGSVIPANESTKSGTDIKVEIFQTGQNIPTTLLFAKSDKSSYRTTRKLNEDRVTFKVLDWKLKNIEETLKDLK